MSRPPIQLTIRQMEMLWAILNHGTMAKAAQEMNISQPAVSRMVRYAEDRTGLQLFERRGSRLIPTTDLKMLAVEFDRVFTNVDRVQRLALSLNAGWGRPVRIATMAMIADTFLVDGLAALRDPGPMPPISIKMNNRAGVERDVQQEDADIGLVHGVIDTATLNVMPFVRGHVICLLPRDHPLAALPDIRPADLDNVDLVSTGRRSPLSREVEQAFDVAGVERRVSVQIGDSRLAARFCAQGMGVALIDPFFIGSLDISGLTVRRFVPNIITACYVIHGKQRSLPEREAALLTELSAVGQRWEAAFAALLDAES